MEISLRARQVIITGHPSDMMIKRGIEQDDVDNAINCGMLMASGREDGLPKYKAVGKRHGKFVTVTFLVYRDIAYVKTVWPSKKGEIAIYEKKRER